MHHRTIGQTDSASAGASSAVSVSSPGARPAKPRPAPPIANHFRTGLLRSGLPTAGGTAGISGLALPVLLPGCICQYAIFGCATEFTLSTLSELAQEMELPRFNHALKCFAEASDILSTAAHAMAKAAEAFSSASLEIEELRQLSGCSSVGSNSVRVPEPSDQSQQSIVNQTDQGSREQTGNARPNSKPLVNYAEEYCSGSEVDSSVSGEDEDQERRSTNQPEQTRDSQHVPAPTVSENQLQPLLVEPSERAVSPPHPGSSSKPSLGLSSSALPPQDGSGARQKRLQSHILVDLEADVLPAVCALAQNYDKLICYMHCPLPSMMMYQKIIKAVTESSVYAVTSLRKDDRTYKAFDRQAEAILLLPELAGPDVTVETSSKFCVVHIGWPSSAERYCSQVEQHGAPHSILVACREDQTMYKSCRQILGLTTPWPNENGDAIAHAISTLFPKIEFALSETPRDVKERCYLDWLEAHGPHGKRRVDLWTPINLVYRANLYLLEVLHYQAEDPSQSSFPPVSQEFVTQNGLEPAVKKGILNLVDSGSGLNHSSTHPSVAKPDGPQFLVSTPATEAAAPTSAPVFASAGTNTTDDNAQKHIPPVNLSETKPVPPLLKSRSAKGGPTSSEPTPSDEYYVVPDDFHIIPTICMLAKDDACKNVICYVKVPGMMQTLALQIQEMTSKPVFVVSTNSTVLQSALKALDSSNGGCIVFCNYLMPLRPELRSKKVDRIIHSGWVGKPDLFSQQIDMGSATTRLSFVMTRLEHAMIPEPERFFGPLQLNLARGTLAPAALNATARQWEVVLGRAPEKSLNGCFMEWIMYHGAGPYKVKNWTTIELATRANAFSGEVLRKRSDTGDIRISEGFMRSMKLQPAVQARILRVK